MAVRQVVGRAGDRSPPVVAHAHTRLYYPEENDKRLFLDYLVVHLIPTSFTTKKNNQMKRIKSDLNRNPV